MKKKNLIIFIIFNIFALPLLITGIVFRALSEITSLYLFGQRSWTSIIMCLVLGAILEGIMLFVMAIANKKIIYFLPNFLLIPLAFQFGVIALWCHEENYEIKLENSNETIVVMAWHELRGGGSVLYEKTSPITMKYICDAPNSHHYTFKYEKDYSIDYYNNGISISYDHEKVYLKYENNKFHKVEKIEEIM